MAPGDGASGLLRSTERDKSAEDVRGLAFQANFPK
jgi:hypothetical protein